MRIFLGLCKDLDIPVVEDKMEKGACIVFLGVTLDSIKMEARLPQDKLDHCLLLVREYPARSHITVSQLESLTGLLNFACRVVARGRPFLRRLYRLKEGMKKRLPHYRLRLSAETKQDLSTWEIFLQSYNGITMFRDGYLTTTGERGICVTRSPAGWRVAKRGQFLSWSWTRPFQQGRQPPVLLSCHGSWWQEPGGTPLRTPG